MMQSEILVSSVNQILSRHQDETRIELLETVNYYSYNKPRSGDKKRKDKDYTAMYIRADRVYRTHMKQVYTWFDLLSDVGGFLRLITTTVGLMFNPFLQKMLAGSLIQNLYLIQRYTKELETFDRKLDGHDEEV